MFRAAVVLSCAGHLIGLVVAAFFPRVQGARGGEPLATGIGRDPRIRASPRNCMRERKVGAVGVPPKPSHNFCRVFWRDREVILRAGRFLVRLPGI